jgi:hypothetical protein
MITAFTGYEQLGGVHDPPHLWIVPINMRDLYSWLWGAEEKGVMTCISLSLPVNLRVLMAKMVSTLCHC